MSGTGAPIARIRLPRRRRSRRCAGADRRLYLFRGPDRSEDEELETWRNAQEQAIVQEHEPKAGDSCHSSTSASHRDRVRSFHPGPAQAAYAPALCDSQLFPNPVLCIQPHSYESGWLPAYRLTPAPPKGTLVVFGGQSYIAQSPKTTQKRSAMDLPFNRPEARHRAGFHRLHRLRRDQFRRG
jgi:hypothetical protein